VDFQLISASHRNLLELVQTGVFREDLYYRLNGIEINLPPLRERADALALIHHLLASESDEPPSLGAEARHALLNYAWPGNIRQLRHVLQMAIALCDGPEIDCSHLPVEIVQYAGATPAARLGLATGMSGTPVTGPFLHGADDVDTSELNAIQVKERETVLELLDEHRWNVSSVAKGLGISRNTLYRKMHRLHIRLSHDGSTAPSNS
jgi:sigma-54 dependent transcriptional regulator, acetoin dehydrogenase operon transcriptional activator AcoR